MTHDGPHHVSMTHPFIGRQLLQLNTKLLNVDVNAKNVYTTRAATIRLGKFSKEVFTGCITSELRMLVYGDLKSKDTKYELSSIFSIVSSFLKNFFFLECRMGSF